MLNINPVNLDR